MYFNSSHSDLRCFPPLQDTEFSKHKLPRTESTKVQPRARITLFPRFCSGLPAASLS